MYSYASNTNKITKHHEPGGRDLIGGVYTALQRSVIRVVYTVPYCSIQSYTHTRTADTLPRLQSQRTSIPVASNEDGDISKDILRLRISW